MALNQTQIANATAIYKYFVSRGWTPQAVCGMLGNIQSESMLYPDQWEIGGGGGYGLVQWTPASKLINWCQSNGLNYKLLDSQCARIQYEMLNGIQFYPSYKYNMKSTQFIKSTNSAYNLALVFIANYERPFNPNQPNRGEQAQYWYNLLSGNSVPNTPTPAPTPTPTDPSGYIKYTIKSGDTLSDIAFKYGVTTNQLLKWNNISNPDKIYVGQVLTIYTNTNNNNNNNNNNNTDSNVSNTGVITYTIKSGDTLSGIALKFNVTVSNLEKWNNISNPDKIYVGQKLTIYASGGGPDGGGIIIYTIKSGDTLSGIAVKFNVTTTELQKWNGISNPDKISVGQSIKIYAKGGGGGGGVIHYTVKSGDTLSGIAVKFNVSVNQIQQWNDISNANLIYPGEVISIYTAGNNNGGTKTYTVKSGDTLSDIAVKCGVTVSELQQWNNLGNPNLIYVGQVLIV